MWQLRAAWKNRTLRSRAASALLLDGRTLYRAEGTENAAVARIGAHEDLTVAALVEELASVRGHAFLFGESAMRAHQGGLKNYVTHSGVTLRLGVLMGFKGFGHDSISTQLPD